MNQKVKLAKNHRINKALDVALQLAAGNLKARGSLSGRGDEIDAIVAGLNMLGEELLARQTEHKKIEEKLKESGEKAKILASYQHAISELRQFYVKKLSFKEMVRKTLSLIIKDLDYYMAWYGELIEKEKIIIPKVWVGKYEKYLDGLKLKLEDKKDAKCAMSKAIITKKPFGYADLEHDRDFEKWRPFALKYGYRSNQAIPLVIGDKCKSAFLIYSTKPKAFSKEAIKYLKGVTDELCLITENIEKRKKAEEKIKKLNLQLQKYAQKLNGKIKRIDEKRVPLTDKEKLTFYGLVRYPNLTSKEVAEKIGMQIATVNSIKNRLRKEGYFKTMYIPRYDLLGCNLLSVIHLSGDIEAMNENVPDKIKRGIFQKLVSTPEKVYFASSEKDAFTITISKDWSDFKGIQDSFEEEYQKKGIKFESYETIQFPSDKSTFYDYFNFATILKERFELDIKDSKELEPKHKKYDLSLNEKKVIYGLIKYPTHTVAKLSKTIGISVPTICKLRKRLVKEGILKIVNFPDFKKIGMELLVLNHNRFIPSSERKSNCCSNPHTFFSITTKTDCITISLYRDYTEAETKTSNYSVACGNRELVKKPMRIIIPLGTIEFSRLEFAPLVKKIFKLD